VLPVSEHVRILVLATRFVLATPKDSDLERRLSCAVT